jgi:hypothetical protein
MSNGNLEIWNTLGRTSPQHTKPFQRAGGFKGTAVKPIYTEQKMTEQFGPCGIGWGISAPQFQLVPGSEGQTVVYCWLSVWVVIEGKRSEPIPGVGGDMVVVKRKDFSITDDEAFKKAFTDALGNAMKHLGMSADIHMGRFDDNKYVNDLRQEEAARQNTRPPQTSDERRHRDVQSPGQKIHIEDGVAYDAKTGEVIPPPLASGRQVQELRTLLEAAKVAKVASEQTAAKWHAQYKVQSFEELSSTVCMKLIKALRGKLDTAKKPAAAA